MRVLVACEYSGRVRDAFIAKGHDAISCDLLPTESPGPHFQGDVFEFLRYNKFDLMIAHPPCTYLTLCGNKWFLPKFSERFPNRLNQRQEAIQFFKKLFAVNIHKICIENPIGIMSTRLRKPDQIIQPFEFGHPVRKSTCLWLKNLPPLFKTKLVEAPMDVFASGNRQSKWHTETGHIKDAGERSKARSKTFQGIADAMAEQWG